MLALAAEIVVRSFPGRPWLLPYPAYRSTKSKRSRAQCLPSTALSNSCEGMSLGCQEGEPLAGLADAGCAGSAKYRVAFLEFLNVIECVE